MKHYFEFFGMLLLCIGLTCHAGDNIIIPVIDKAKLTEAIDKLSDKYNIPDFAVTIVNKDSVLLSYEKNNANSGKNYLIGSCSKSFTAMAIMKLADEKYLSLDDPVKKFLPWFELKNPANTNKVTILHLLSQKSGFERQHGFFDVKVDNIEDFEKNLSVYLRKLELRHEPGTAFLYSNLNYILLGLIVKHITGQSYADYLTINILPAARMNNTYCTAAENHKNNLITAYQYSIASVPFRSGNYYYSDFIVPAGYISSNISDLGNYLQLMLNNTITNAGDTILSEKAYGALTGKGQTGYAMGWFRYAEDSAEVINHSGLDENFASSFAFFPEYGLGSVVLCNINSLEFCGRVDQEIRSAVFGKTYPPPAFSMEKTMRRGALILPLLILLGLIYNMVQWRKKETPLGFVPGVWNNVRLFLVILLSFFLLFAVTRTFQMPIGKSIRFQPDIGWGLIMIAVFGTISGFLRYFSKTKD